MTQAKTAIVTGAGKRVGAAITHALVADGWTVIGQTRSEEDRLPKGAIQVVAGLAELDGADRLFAAAEGLPRPSLLVNNAARFVCDSADAFNPSEFDTHMAVNVRAPLLLSKRFAAGHGEGDALIVNILDAKLSAPNPDYLSYTLSKQALGGATGLLARAFASKGIRVNAIAPALMLRSPGQTQENFERMHGANPLGRGVNPEDLVAALRYLVSATRVTGQTITIDGGQSFMQLARDVQFAEDE